MSEHDCSWEVFLEMIRRIKLPLNQDLCGLKTQVQCIEK